jgi:hypothetical protein
LRQSALRLVFGGQTTLHEINRVTFVEELEYCPLGPQA